MRELLRGGILATVLFGDAAFAADSFLLVEKGDDTILHRQGQADSAGDLLIVHNSLYDPKSNAAVGTDQGYCVRIEPGKSWQCTLTFFLKNGQISVSGPFFDDRDSTMTITGGATGYRNAKGSIAIHAREGRSGEYELRFDVS